MVRFFEAIGRFAVRFKYPVVIFWIAFTVFAVAAWPPLSSVTKDTNSSFLPGNSPSMQASNLAAPFQSLDLASADIVASRAGGPLTTADQAAVNRVIALVKRIPSVRLVRDEGVSRDGQARQVLVQAAVSINGSGTGAALVQTIRDDFVRVGAPAGLSLHLTGELGVTVDNQHEAGKSQGRTQDLSYVFIIVLLLLAFRALLAPLITLLPAALVLALSGPVIAASTHLGVQASSITQVILIVLILGAGTDYGLFLVFRVREELRRGLAPADAVVRALTAVGETITFSAFTVMAAMLSLLLAEFGFYQGLGPALAIGIALMLLSALTFLPALLAIFGRAVFWPTKVVDIGGERAGVWGRISVTAVRRPAITLVAGVAFLVALALGLLNTGTTGFGDVTTGPKGSDSALGDAAIAAHYPGSSTTPSLVLFRYNQPIWSHPASLDTIQQQMLHSWAFVTIVGPLNPNNIPLTSATLVQLHRQLGPAQLVPAVQPAGSTVAPILYNAYRATAQFISADGHTVQWTTVLKYNNDGLTADLNQVPNLRTEVARIGSVAGAQATGVFGQIAFAYDVGHTATDDLFHIIPLVAVIIAILLGLVLRSVIAPLYLVASVVLSYLAALGFAALVFVHLGTQSGLNFVLPFLVFIFLTALGSDYNILVMTRIREEAHRLPLRQAVPLAIGVSGTTVTSAGMILAGTFAVLAIAAGNAQGADQIRQIGYGIAAGVIMDTFLIRTLLVPSMVVLVGRWNWFPSALFRNHPREPVSSEAEIAPIRRVAGR